MFWCEGRRSTRQGPWTIILHGIISILILILNFRFGIFWFVKFRDLSKVSLQMTSLDIDERSCESFHDDIPLMDSEKEFLRNTKNRHNSKATLLIYVLVAHALGWILALQVPWSFNRPKLTGGDDANRIVPPSKYLKVCSKSIPKS